MDTETIYVTVKVKIIKGADPDDVITEMNYSLEHDAIISTEIEGIRYGS